MKKKNQFAFEHLVTLLLLVMMMVAMCAAFWMAEINLISTIVGSVSTVFVMSVGYYFKSGGQNEVPANPKEPVSGPEKRYQDDRSRDQ